MAMNSDSEPSFCLTDVCRSLELANPRHVKKRLSEKGVFLNDTLTDGGIQQMVYIDEANLYRCIFQCRKKKSALRFQDWVFEEVLPSIRKDGGYMLMKNEETEEELMARALAVAKATLERREKRIRLLESENVALSNQLSALAPKVSYFDTILSSPNSVVVTQIAKDYGMSPQEFNKRIASLGVQYKANGQWVLYAKYQREGYTDSHTGTKRNSNGSWMLTTWTQKGRFFLYNLLKEHNVLPVIERYSGYNLPPVKNVDVEPDPIDSFYR